MNEYYGLYLYLADKEITFHVRARIAMMSGLLMYQIVFVLWYLKKSSQYRKNAQSITVTGNKSQLPWRNHDGISYLWFMAQSGKLRSLVGLIIIT